MKTHDRRITALKQLIYKVSYYLEYIMAFAIIIAILLSLTSLPYQLSLMLDQDSDSFTNFLQYVMNLIIGIEFLHVICRLNLDSVIEVLMLTVTRSIIIEHMATGEILLGVAAIGILFLIRKFLYIPKKDKAEEEDENAHVFAFLDRKKHGEAESAVVLKEGMDTADKLTKTEK